MTNYGKVRSFEAPQEIEFTTSNVFIATNIEEKEEIIDDVTRQYYEYDYVSYTKDEFLGILANQKAEIEELKDELSAAKILLGVE